MNVAMSALASLVVFSFLVVLPCGRTAASTESALKTDPASHASLRTGTDGESQDPPLSENSMQDDDDDDIGPAVSPSRISLPFFLISSSFADCPPLPRSLTEPGSPFHPPRTF